MTPIRELFTLPRQRIVGWIVAFSLGLSVIYSLFYFESFSGASFHLLSNKSMVNYSFSNSLVSASLDPFIWGITSFAILGCLLLTALTPKTPKKVGVCFSVLSIGLAGWVCAVLSGLLSVFSLVFVSVILLVVCCAFAGLFSFSRLGLLKCIVLGSASVAVVVEVGALILFNLPYTLNLSFAASAVATNWRLVELSFSNLAYPLLPYGFLFLILLGISAYLVELGRSEKFLEKFGKSRVLVCFRRLRLGFESLKDPKYEPISAHFPLALALLISFIVTVLFVVITVLPWFNPTNRLVSVDAPVYYEWLAHMRGLDAGSALQFAVHNDRALFLVLSYGLSFVFPSIGVIQLIPALLIPLFIVVSLYLTKLLCGFKETWVYLVLIAPFSIQALALIYSGYYANMLAVVFVYLYFILMLKFSSTAKRLSIIPLLGVSLLILFSHSWAWYVFVASLAAFLLLEWRNTVHEPTSRQPFKWRILAVALTVIVGLVADYARSLLASTSASLSFFETASSGLSLPNTAFILNGLQLTTNFYLGGVFSSAIILALCIVGFLFMLTYKSVVSRLLVSWFLIGCVAVLFASGEYVFNRFIFLMPTLTFSALGLTLIARVGAYTAGKSRIKRVFFELLIVGLILLLLINFALNYASNISML